MKTLCKQGDRVSAPAKDGSVQDGVIVDVLSVMYYITFDDGTDNWVYHVDRNLTKRERG
jgi:hypothetical protein